MKKDKSDHLLVPTDEIATGNASPSRRTALRGLSLAAAALGLAIGAQPGSAATKKIKFKNQPQKTAKFKNETGTKSSGDGFFKRSKN